MASTKMSTRKIKITPYMKNVGRSLGYAVGDAVAAYNPTISNILSTTKDTVSSAKTSMSDIKMKAVSGFKDIHDSQNAVTNIIDDLKSGNWYNKERIDGGMFGDSNFDFDDNWDDNWDDWGDDVDVESSSGNDAKSIIEENANNTDKIVSTASENISKSFGYASAKSADYIVKSTNQSLGAMYQLNAQGFNQVSNILLGMNTTLTGIAQLGAPLSEHMQNSAVFFTNTTQTLSNIDKNLEKLVNRTAFLERDKKYKNKYNTLGDMLFDGSFDFSSYMDMVKDNYKETKELATSLFDMVGMMYGKGGKNASPLASALTGAIKLAIPQVAKDSMKEFNKSISEAIGVSLKRASKKAKNSDSMIVNLLGDIFGIKDEFKTNFSTFRYEKGPVSWDGIARKSVVEVIPTYLAKIYAALGGEEKYYDYEKGKFATLDSIKKEKEEFKNNYAKRAGSDFRYDLLEEIRKSDKYKDKDRINKEIEEFFIKCFINDIDLKDLEGALSNSSDLTTKFGLSGESAKIIKQYIKSSKNDLKKTRKLLNFENNISIERSKYTKYVKNEEKKGYSTLSYANNNFSKEVKDKSEQETTYLQGLITINENIYKYLSGKTMTFDAKKGTFTYKEPKVVSTSTVKNQDSKSPTEADIKYFDLSEDERKAKLKDEKIKKDADKVIEKVKGKFGEKTNWLSEYSQNNAYERVWGQFATMLNSISEGITSVFYGNESITSYIKKKFFESDLWNAVNVEYETLKNKITDKWGQFKQSFVKGYKANAQLDNLYNYGSGSGLPSGGDSAIESTYYEQRPDGSLWRIKPDGTRVRAKGKEHIDKIRARAQRMHNESAEGTDVTSKFGGNLGIGTNKMVNSISKFSSKLFSTGNAKDDSTNQGKIRKAFGEFFNKENLGAIGIGAGAGVGVSLLTGALFGPLAGAAIGAGTGLIAKSKVVQDTLFGEGDPDDPNYKKGLLGGIGKAIKKNLDSIKSSGIGGAAGLIGGTLLGSPIIGLIAGSSIGFASKSNKVKNYLFGEGDLDNGLISKELQNKVKKALPNIAVGAVAGLVAGPLGIVGNMVLGSSIGFLTTTDKFKEYIFGNGKDKKGLAGTIAEKVLNPLDEIMHNVAESTKQWLKNTGRSIGGKLKSFFRDRISRYNDGDRGLLTSIIGLGGKVIGAPISLAGKALSGVRNRSIKHNLKNGYNVWNREEKRWYTAEERNQLRNQYGLKNSKFDEAIASAKSKEDLLNLQKEIQDAQDPSLKFKKDRNAAINELYREFEAREIPAKVADKIVTLIKGNNGDERALKELEKLGYVIDESLERKIRAIYSRLASAKNTKESRKNIRQLMKDKLGISGKSLYTASDMINSEIKKFDENQTPENSIANDLNKMQPSVSKIADCLDIITKTKRANNVLNNDDPKDTDEKRIGRIKDAQSKEGIFDYISDAKVGFSDFTDVADDEIAALAKGVNSFVKGVSSGAHNLLKSVGISAKNKISEGIEGAEEASSNLAANTNYTGKWYNRLGRSVKNKATKVGGFVKGLFSKKNKSNIDNYDTISSEADLAGSGSEIEGKKSSSGSIFNLFGKIKTKLNSQGEEVVDNQDAETLATQKKTNKFLESISSVSILSKAFSGVTNILTKIKTGLFGDKDEDGEKGSTFKNILSKVGSVVKGIGAALLGTGAISYLWQNKDSIKSTITNQVSDDGFVGKIWNFISGTGENTLKGTIGKIREFLFGTDSEGGAIDKAKGYASKAFDYLGEKFGTIFDAVFSEDGVLHPIFESISTIRKNLIDSLFTDGGTLNNIFKNLGELAVNFTNSLTSEDGIIRRVFTGFANVADQLLGDINDEDSAIHKVLYGTADIAANILNSDWGLPAICTLLAANAASNLLGGGKGSKILSLIKSTWPLAVAGAGFTLLNNAANGTFDNAVESVNSYMSDDTVTITDSQGNTETYGQDESFSTNFKQETARGLLRQAAGAKSTTSIAGLAGKAGKALANAEFVKGNSFMTDVDNISELSLTSMSKFAKVLSKIPLVGDSIATYADYFIARVTEVVKNAASKLSESKLGTVTKKAGSFLKNAAQLLNVALAGYYIGQGWDDAASIIGITGTPTSSERLAGAIINAFINCVPFLSLLITPAQFYDCWLDAIDFYTGDPSKTADMRARKGEAEETVRQWAESQGLNPEDVSVSAYNEAHDNGGSFKKLLKMFGTKEGRSDIWAGTKLMFTDMSESLFNPDKKGTFAEWFYNHVTEPVGDFFTKGIPDALQGALDTVKTTFDPNTEGTFGSWLYNNVTEPVGDFFTQTIPNGLENLTNGVKDLFDPNVEDSPADWFYKNVTEPIGDFFTKTIPEGFKAALENTKEALEEAGDWYDENIVNSDFNTWVWDNITSKIFGDPLAGSGAGLPSGGSSGFVSQKDSKYSGYSIGGKSFADNGCGPSVAAMAANAMGHNMSVSEAVSSSKPYQNSGGVSIDYFQKALGNKGIKTQVISGGGAGDIYNSLANGNKAILLGRDPSNTSKAFSPFGPKNHYVLATGLDNRGNVVVNDPELKRPRTYSPSILRSTSYAVSGGGSFIKNKFRKSRTPLNMYYGGGSGTLIKTANGYKVYSVNSANTYQNIAGYLVFVPETYTSSSQLPMIIFNHGLGENGKDPSKLISKANTLSKLLVDGTISFVNAIIVCPQAVSTPTADALINLANDVCRDYSIDTNRISITGFSQGAIASSNALKKDNGNTFSCGVLVCDYNSYSSSTIPIIKFSGTSDSDTYSKTKTHVQKDISANKNISGYVFYNKTHTQVFDVYKKYNVLSWMISQLLNSPVKVSRSYNEINLGDNISEFSGNYTNSTSGVFDTKKAIWDFFRSRGWTEYGAAGAMGCWEAESSNNPKRLEGDYLSEFKNGGSYDTIIPGTTACDNFVENVLFKKYDNQGLSINKNAYKSGGHLYPGMGLAQWTGSRTIALNKYAQQNNMNPYDLKTQLDYAASELNNGKKSTDNSMKSVNELYQATKIFGKGYEGVPESSIAKRAELAKNIYNQYSGSTITTDFNNLGSANYYGDSSSSSTNIFSSILSLASNIGTIFSNAFNAIFGKNTSTTDSSNSYTSSDGLTYNANGYNSSISTSDIVSYANAHANDYKSINNQPGYLGQASQSEYQNNLLNKIASIAGTIIYSNKVQDPDQGKASCASGLGWAYRKVTGINGMSASPTTLAVDDRFVPIYSNFDDNNTLDKAFLQPGDLLFEGTKSGSLMRHVEMYNGEGGTWNFGSTKGGVDGSPYNPVKISNIWFENKDDNHPDSKLRMITRLADFVPDSFSNGKRSITGGNDSYTYNSGSYSNGTTSSNNVSDDSYGGLTGNDLLVAKYYAGEISIPSSVITAIRNEIGSERFGKAKHYGEINRKNTSSSTANTNTSSTLSNLNNNLTTANVSRATSSSNNNTSSTSYSLNNLSNIARVSGGASGLLNSIPVQKLNTVNAKRYRSLHHISGSGSGLSDYEITSMLNNIKNDPELQNGSVSADLVASLVDAITRLLSNIADNTAPVEKIYQALVTYMSKSTVSSETLSGSGTGDAKAVKIKANNKSSSHNMASASSDIDSNVRNLVGVLAQLAKG